MPGNCERHPHLPGTYILYDAAGYAFRARKVGKSWWAKPSHMRASADPRVFTDDTLRELAKRVEYSYWTV